MARDLKYTENYIDAGKTTTTSVFFYTGKSHKKEEVLQQWTGWLRSKKEVLQLHLQLQLVLEFSRQGEALPETLPITLILLILQDTLILL
jgi:hypothetical protein